MAPSTNAPFSFSRRTTKLSLDDLSAPPSSDPPMFSSDDYEPGLEDYTCGAKRATGVSEHSDGSKARKRQYRGTWWGEKLRHVEKKRRKTFESKRDMDSGVWMLSSDDSSQLMSDDIPMGGLVDRRGHTVEPSKDVHDDDLAKKFTSANRIIETEAQRHARSAINRCLEEGNDNVDLSYLNIETIPPGLLQPLIQITKEPVLENVPPSEKVYVPLEPFLRLYLPQNRLFYLPKETFDLQDLKVLSLRQNKLTEIPCAIQKLTKLQDLNIAVNRLSYLPWELLSLMQTGDLKRLTAHPNPFIKLNEVDIAEWHCEIEEGDTPFLERLKTNAHPGDANSQGLLPLHIATSNVTYFDMEGNPKSHPDIAVETTRAQSLRELALQACLRSPQTSHFIDIATMDTMDDGYAEYPPFVLRLFEFAKVVKRSGERTCSVCKRVYVVPRVEWVEWWDCTPYENGSKIPRVGGQRLWPLPFIRRGCSWDCVKRKSK